MVGLNTSVYDIYTFLVESYNKNTQYSQHVFSFAIFNADHQAAKSADHLMAITQTNPKLLQFNDPSLNPGPSMS